MRVLKTESIEVALVLCNIGLVFASKGEYDQALENYNKCLVIQKKVLGPESIQVATTFNNIGGLYNDKGVYE